MGVEVSSRWWYAVLAGILVLLISWWFRGGSRLETAVGETGMDGGSSGSSACRRAAGLTWKLADFSGGNFWVAERLEFLLAERLE